MQKKSALRLYNTPQGVIAMCKINEEMLKKEARRTSIEIAKNLLTRIG